MSLADFSDEFRAGVKKSAREIVSICVSSGIISSGGRTTLQVPRSTSSLLTISHSLHYFNKKYSLNYERASLWYNSPQQNKTKELSIS